MIELMVALTIGSLIVGFCYTAFSFGDMLYFDWVRRNDLKEMAAGTAQRIAFDLQSAKKVIFGPDSTMVMLETGGRQVCYRFSSDRVSRDSVSLNLNPPVWMKARIEKFAGKYNVVIVGGSGSHVYSARVVTRSLESSASKFIVSGENANQH